MANQNSPQKHVWQAQIVLLTADGRGTAEITVRSGGQMTISWVGRGRLIPAALKIDSSLGRIPESA